MRAAFLASLLGAAACDSVFSVDHVAGPDAPSDVCVQDSFDGSTLDLTKWTPFGMNTGVNVFTAAGFLQFDVPEQTTASQDPIGDVHAGTRNMVGASFEAELVQVPDIGQPSSAGLSLFVDGTHQYRLIVSNGQLLAQSILAGPPLDVSQRPYDPVAERFLRIRHDTGTNELVFETRGGETSYVTYTRIALALDLAAIDTLLYAESYNPAPAFSARFDSALVTGPACH